MICTKVIMQSKAAHVRGNNFSSQNVWKVDKQFISILTTGMLLFWQLQLQPLFENFENVANGNCVAWNCSGFDQVGLKAEVRQVP